MTRNRAMPTVLAAAVVLALAPALRADTKLILSHSSHRHPGITGHAGIGIWIGKPVPPPMCYPPVHREVVITRPWHRRVVHVGPPVVVHPPVVYPPVVVHHPPVERRVIIESAPPVVEEGSVTVWITNSNGSRSTVRLTRQGPWYIGPRGEYYEEMPTNEQLRVAYGF